MDNLLNVPMSGLLTGESAEIFKDVDQIFERSLVVGDPLIALEYVQRLQKESLVKGLAIAKLMYRVKQNWDFYTTAGVEETFENMVEFYNGYAPATVEKYIRMWEGIFENPALSEELKNQLSGRPVKDLLLLTAAAREGSLSEEDWDKVTVAENSQKVRDIVRKARNEATSSRTAITIMLQTRPEGVYPIGTLSASMDGERTAIGLLDLSNDDPIAIKAIERIINRIGILKV